MAQLIVILSDGTLLAQRWDEEVGGVNLYYVPNERRGFFAEIGIDDDQGRFVVLRSFSDSEALTVYAQGVRLPGE